MVSVVFTRGTSHSSQMSWLPIYCNIPDPLTDKTGQVVHAYHFTKKEQWSFLQQQLETLFKLIFLAFTKVILKHNLHNT